MVTWLVKTPLSYSRSTFFSDEWNMFFGLSEETEFEHPKPYLGGGFKHSLFLPLIGEMIQFDYIILFRWVETTNQISLPLYVFFFLSRALQVDWTIEVDVNVISFNAGHVHRSRAPWVLGPVLKKRDIH